MRPGVITGLHMGLSSGVNPSEVTPAAYPTSLAEIGTLMGYDAPTHAWRLNDDSSVADLAGTYDLTAAGTPTEASDEVMGVGVAFDVGSTDSLAAGDDAAMDVTTGDFMVLAVLSWSDYLNGRYFVSKRNGASYHVVRADADGGFRAILGDGSSFGLADTTLTTYRDSSPVVLAYGRWSGAPFIVTDREDRVDGSAFAGSLTNTGTFRFGGGAANSQGFTGYFGAGWSSITTEPTRAHLQALKAAMGF